MDKHYENLKTLFKITLDAEAEFTNDAGEEQTNAQLVKEILFINSAEERKAGLPTGPKDACKVLFTEIEADYGEAIAKSEVMQAIVFRYVYELFYAGPGDGKIYVPLWIID